MEMSVANYIKENPFNVCQPDEEYLLKPVTDFTELTHVMGMIAGPYHEGIIRVTKLQNNYLWSQWVVTLEEEEALSKGSVVKMLFHDTPVCNVSSIARFNFDRRAVKRARFGQGVSFALTPQYANEVSAKKCQCGGYRCLDGIKRAMIITDVLVGKCYTTNANYSVVIPRDGCDTTVSSNGQVFVKFFDNEFLPRYFVEYMSKYRANTNRKPEHFAMNRRLKRKMGRHY